jgi:CheY-like chemotaxis protein
MFRPDVLLRDPVIRDTKVVVMTAQSLAAEPRSLAAGAEGFLSKPFEVDAVRGLLARLFGPRH